MPDTKALSSLLLAAERALMTHEVRTRPERLCALLASDFREIGRSGCCYDLADILVALPAETTPMEVDIDDFQTAQLSETIAQVTYTTRRSTEDGALVTRRSSLWRLEADGLWRMVFHQGTPVP